MPPRAAVFECPCCLGSTSLPLQPGERAPARRACPNGGCWSCLGACRGTAQRVEVVRLPAASLQFLAQSAQPRPASTA
jgi:hypothetical protein